MNIIITITNIVIIVVIVIRNAWSWLNKNFFCSNSETLSDTSYDNLIVHLEHVIVVVIVI